MNLRTKQVLVAIGLLVAVGIGIAIGVWRDRHASITEGEPDIQSQTQTHQAAQSSATEPAQVPRDDAESVEVDTEATPVGVCAGEGKTVLDHYFTATSAPAEQWRTTLNAMLSPAGIAEQDLIDQRLILQQAQIGWPASVEGDPKVGTIYCEGLSDRTGWFIQLSRQSIDEPWLVDSIRAYEPTLGYAPPRLVNEE